MEFFDIAGRGNVLGKDYCVMECWALNDRVIKLWKYEVGSGKRGVGNASLKTWEDVVLVVAVVIVAIWMGVLF